MARETSTRRLGRKGGSGRVTPAKDRTPSGRSTSGRSTSGRYTPPIPREVRVSSVWVPIAMGVLLVVGALTIILNYLELLPGAASNAYLLVGLGLITGGFITATQWH